MKTRITDALRKALSTLQAEGKIPSDIDLPLIQVEWAKDPKHGDFASNLAMILAKPSHQNPRQLADLLVERLPAIEGVKEVTVANPGFINFIVTDSYFEDFVPFILRNASDYGSSTLGAGKRLHIEVVSANPTGPLHVGHGRLAAYSASVANVLETAGFSVHREYYVNDAGRQMQILAASVWLRYLGLFGENAVIPRRGYKGEYIIDIAKDLKQREGDRFYRPLGDLFLDLPLDDEEHQESHVDALIQKLQSLLGSQTFNALRNFSLNSILQDIKEDLSEFGVTCQAWFRESQLEETGDIKRGIDRLEKSGHLYQKDGAIWFRSTDYGDEKDRVVVRENGQPTYFASDIGYHLNKLERGFHELLDIYGADHHGYIPRLRALAIALGESPEKIKVLLVQFAILYRGKIRVSMSTRGGEFVTLRELRNEVGNDAARFFYIMRRRDQHLDFDLELAKSESSDNPVYYIQYAYARICSVFRQLEQRELTFKPKAGEQALNLLTTPHEKALLRCLSRYPEIIESAASGYEPGIIAHYLQELANYFHTYYNAYPFIVDEESLRDARLCLIAATRQVLGNGLRLLGLSTPEIM